MNEFSDATNTKVTIGSTLTTVLALKSTRRYASFVNDSDETIYLSLGATATMNKGIRLNANGGVFEIRKGNGYNGIITAICSSGSKNLTVVEA